MKVILNNQEIIVNLADSFFKRLFGLMGKKNIKKGIIFPKCNSIHTFFMKEKIDVIMTNRNNEILYLFPNLKKWRIILPKKDVFYTYELPANSIKNLELGQKMTILK